LEGFGTSCSVVVRAVFAELETVSHFAHSANMKCEQRTADEKETKTVKRCWQLSPLKACTFAAWHVTAHRAVALQQKASLKSFAGSSSFLV
jgi:hypothetical protein